MEQAVTITVPQIVVALLAAMGIPGAITGFIVWNFQRKIAARDKQKEEEANIRRKERADREAAQEKNMLYVIRGIDAAIALGEATARAVQRIPDAHCNGDMHAALDYAARMKHERKDFLSEQAIKALY